MRAVTRFLISAGVWLVCLSSQAAHTKVTLLLSAETARPGDTILAGVRLQMEPGWHTYWRNSGASGMPTEIAWQLPEGITAAATSWPTPEKLPEEDLTTYIYTNEVVLLVPLNLASGLAPGTVTLKAKVSWLECESECIPGKDNVEAKLAVGSETKLSNSASLLEQWQSRIPKPPGALDVKAAWAAVAKGDVRPLTIEWHAAGPASEADFFPFASEDFEVLGPTQTLPSEAGVTRLRKEVKKYAGEWPESIRGVIVQGAGSHRQGNEVVLHLGSATGKSAVERSSGGTATMASGPGVASPKSPSLWKMLLYALIGGLILNIMPCVLPVIALKILGFVGQSREAPALVRKLGFMYALGVLASFLALAGLVIGVKAAGHEAGWGMQLGNPEFLVILTVLVTLVALNLFGVFEVSLGGNVMGAASEAASRHGLAGSFFNGVLATTLATPCTAPFLGAALGFAFLQSAPIIILMFLTVGVGLALPYVVLSWEPRWLRFLPKPGPWMAKFRFAMGFPMLATAFWLFGLLPIHYGDRAWWLGIFLVIVALGAWVFGEFFQRGRRRRGVAAATAVGIVLAGYAVVLENELQWRSPGEPGFAGGRTNPELAGLESQPWSPEAVASARAEGRPVLVDFTAKWCLTCNLIVKPALESSEVRKRLAEVNGVVLVGDYTRFPDNITEELNRFGRAGVPLVVIYPKKTESPPIVLPEALTPGMVVDALNRAAAL